MRFGLILAVAILVSDQVSKWIVLDLLNFSPPGCRQLHAGCGFIELSPILDLRMVWNEGVSFGLLTAGSEFERWALVALQGAIAAFFLWWLRSAERRLTAAALGLVIGGALGNVIDRIRYGAVVDFLDANGLYFPWVFNVADAAINVGAALLAIEFLILRREAKLRAEAAPAPGPAPKSDPAS